MSQRIMVAMSGGLDSSMACYLLIHQGYTISGVTMRLFEPSSFDAENDAHLIAQTLGFPHRVLTMEEAFSEEVILPFIEAYQKGETPNPCILCNRTIKFGKFLKWALDQEYNCIATGHYAKIEKDTSTGRYLLKKAADLQKDQSYFLYTLSQQQLSHLKFPLGDKKKSELKALAQKLRLPIADKPESQDICFIGKGSYSRFIASRSEEPKPGDFIDAKGQTIGKHKGVIYYTIGQRKGLGVAAGKPLFVTAIDAKNNTVSLGEEEELFSSRLLIQDVHWIPFEELQSKMKCKVKIRSSQQEQPAWIYPLSSKQTMVEFDYPQRAITPGQSAVFYQNDLVIGGGVIRPEAKS